MMTLLIKMLIVNGFSDAESNLLDVTEQIMDNLTENLSSGIITHFGYDHCNGMLDIIYSEGLGANEKQSVVKDKNFARSFFLSNRAGQ
jgi:hypothetical protein